jgi:hypothetical protein
MELVAMSLPHHVTGGGSSLKRGAKLHSFQISAMFFHLMRKCICGAPLSTTPCRRTGHGGIAPCSLKLRNRWRRVASFKPRPIYLRGRNIKADLEIVWMRKILPCWELDPGSSPDKVATDWTKPAPPLMHMKWIIDSVLCVTSGKRSS